MALGLTPQQIIDKDVHPLLRISENWTRVDLNLVANIQNGYAFPSKEFSKDSGLPLIRIRDILKHETEDFYTGNYPVEFLVDKGDILIGMDGDFNASVWKGPRGLLNQRVCRVLPTSNNYFDTFLIICLQPYLDAINSETSAVTVKHLSSKTIQQIPIPLPPLPEQRVIVSKIEQLFSDLDNGIDNFKKAQEQLKRYRQSVLKAACEGKLVPTEAELAHSEGRDYEPADVLLARIVEERREKWNGKGKYKEPATLDTSGLPEGWMWTISDAIFWFVTSGSRGWAKYYSETGPIFLRVGNLNHESISLDLNYIQRVQPPVGTEGTRTQIIAGDILISITADVGMVALVPDDMEEAYINQHVSLARPVLAINPHYLAWFLASQVGGQKQFVQLQRGATKKGLGLDDIRSINIPLPPLAEQHRIVFEIETRISICDKMEATIAESLQKAESLRQSILKKAFEGKLLNEIELEEARNAPDWEPAEKLVERIRQEKQIKENNNKPTRRKTHG